MFSLLSPFCAGWFAGTAWQLQERDLMAWWSYAGMCISGLLLWMALGWAQRRAPAHRQYLLAAAVCAVACAMAFGQTGWRATYRMQQALVPALEGQTLSLAGVVAAMPQRVGDSWRFRFEVEHAPVGVPPYLLLGWYGSSTWGLQSTGVADPPPDLRAGDRWRFDVRLKAPHGHINPHGFDYELWLWEQNLQATGYVRTGRKDNAAEWLASTHAHWIERARQSVRESIELHLNDRHMTGLVAALLVGDQAAIERNDWDVFRATGVAHLMAISGLHITGLAWISGLLFGLFWQHSGRWFVRRPWSLWLPASQAGQIFGCLVALAYALFTGWGVPAQRTVWMLVTVVLLRWQGRRWPWPNTWGLVCVVVLALDPWAMMQAGFWLSFVAVGMLFASGNPMPALQETTTWRQRLWQRMLGVLREQWLMSICLAPLSLLLFHQVSVVGLMANLLAVPWVTLLVTPLCLFGILFAPFWSLAAWFLQGLMVCLNWMAAWSWATWSAPAAPWWVSVAAMLGMLVWALRLPGWIRLGGVSMVLPLLCWQSPRPASGTFELIAADMGQGHAVLVRTASHTLLYDTGPRYSAETDAGQRVLVPLLRSLGEHLDGVIISHQDSDHSGGAMSVLAMQPQAQVWTSIPEQHALQTIHPMQRCERGQHWVWDGVQFDVLHPEPEDYVRRLKPNAMSCVLRVHSPGGSSALLAGDIEAPQEIRLVQQGQMLQADWLLVPHHGSATSSTSAFLDAVQPLVAVVQSGYRNRFAHPHPDVLTRYDALGVLVVQSSRCGASSWRSDSPMLVHCEREKQQRYWHHRLP